MEKMFKRTLLGAAVALAATSANAAIELNGQAVQLYGQAAGFMHFVNADAADDMAVQAVIESRVGLKGTVQFDNFAPDFVWQIESGNADSGKNGYFGGRDTFLGLSFDGVGSFKFGRQLVASYNYVDWPHSNPGLGNVFDGGGSIKATFQDRADNVLRFDSANWGGLSVQATLSNMQDTTEAMVISAAVAYNTDMFGVHAATYQGASNKVAGVETGDQSYNLVGGNLNLGPVTLTAAYKMMDNGITDDSQDAVSATAQYVNGSWVFKTGYAQTFESDKNVDGSTAITGRLGYLLPSTYLYVDVRSYDYNEVVGDATRDATNVLVGAEYYF